MSVPTSSLSELVISTTKETFWASLTLAHVVVIFEVVIRVSPHLARTRINGRYGPERIRPTDGYNRHRSSSNVSHAVQGARTPMRHRRVVRWQGYGNIAF